MTYLQSFFPLQSSSESVSWFTWLVAAAVALQLCEYNWIRCLWSLQERWWGRMTQWWNPSPFLSICTPTHLLLSASRFPSLIFCPPGWLWFTFTCQRRRYVTPEVCSFDLLQINMTALSSVCWIHSSRESRKQTCTSYVHFNYGPAWKLTLVFSVTVSYWYLRLRSLYTSQTVAYTLYVELFWSELQIRVIIVN